MFSFLPPFKGMDTPNIFPALSEAFQIYHATVNDITYRSRGEERRLHKHCIFHYTVKGHGYVLHNGKTYKTSAGQGFFNIINEPNCGYGYPEDETEPWEFVVICFKGDNMRQLAKQLIEKQPLYTADPQAFQNLCKNLYNEEAGAKITFLPKLISLITQSEENFSRITKAFSDIVQRDIMLNPTICAIAREMGISREHLQRSFFLENGITPAKYIANKRVETLCILLSTDMKEGEIALQMNFSSLGAMTAFFKKHLSLTPSQYRKNKFLFT